MPPPDQHKFQPPKGTRDFYPQEMLRRRYLEKAWRDTAIRHGFEEIDGPTFEHTELYTVKSGEAILGEVFGVFSGKDEEQVSKVAAGQAPYALRPEFTPTLARMYAARAAQLGKPTKWFWQQNCFRAERPQRGRLREFGQWNVDFIGGEANADADAEIISTVVELLSSLNLSSENIRVRVSDRRGVLHLLNYFQVPEERHTAVLSLLDASSKLEKEEARRRLKEIGLPDLFIGMYLEPRGRDFFYQPREQHESDKLAVNITGNAVREFLEPLRDALNAAGVAEWCDFDLGIVRGLAYYTGMVFEVHESSGAERAIAGGGRYDGLIELFGGPPTPAVGFGMGDVVLSNLLADRGLMPEGKALLDKLSEPPASLRPDVFVIANEKDDSQAALRPLVATLRREGLHARHSYKATKNIGKLLTDANACHARFAAIIESGSEVTLRNLDERTEAKNVPLAEVALKARASALRP